MSKCGETKAGDGNKVNFELMQLALSADQWVAICAHLTAGLPEEACGLLAGRAGQTHKVYLMTNARHSPTRYEMEPRELVQALEEMDERDWELTGIFHSHPAGPPTPSPADIAEAYYPDSAYVICSLDRGEWQARAVEIREGRTLEIELRIGTGDAT